MAVCASNEGRSTTVGLGENAWALEGVREGGTEDIVSDRSNESGMARLLVLLVVFDMCGCLKLIELYKSFAREIE